MIFILVAAAALQATTPSLGAPASAAADRKAVCRSDTATGSHFAKRICHSTADWKALDAERERVGRAANASRSGMQMEPFSKQQY